MTEKTTNEFRGTPPGDKGLAKQLGPKYALWRSVIGMVTEFGATWRWVHSETTGQWSYRSYLPGERFFVALSTTSDGFEVSLNLKPEEWDAIPGQTAAESARLSALQDAALATGDDPAWVHVPVTEESEFPMLAKLFFARGRRVQPPRKGRRKR